MGCGYSSLVMAENKKYPALPPALNLCVWLFAKCNFETKAVEV
jgi:hypothetical protein